MEITPFQLVQPSRIFFGANKSLRIGTIAAEYGRTVLLVHGKKSFLQSPLSIHILNSFTDAGCRIYEYEVHCEPSPQLVDAAVAEYKSHGIEVVCAVGGGSVIDAGKAVSAMLPLDRTVQDFLEGIGTVSHPGTKVPFIAVPTTAGTGTEATYNAVLSQTGINGFKKSLRHVNLMPTIAVVDPLLAMSCPSDVAGACGMDALTQLLESFISTKATPVTDCLALEGLSRLKDNLITVSTKENTIHAQSNVSYAALLSGITLANAGLCVVHGFASSIGGMFDIPHGIVCGTLLAPCMRMTIDRLLEQGNAENSLRKFADAGQMLFGIKKDSVESACLDFADALDKLTSTLNIPKLSQFGIRDADCDTIIEKTELKNNPAILSKDDLRKIVLSRL